MVIFGSSISKPLDSSINEDSIRKAPGLIAVSDGAGGGGLYAEKWSQYLVENLPEKPILNYLDFCNWLDSIWESFFNNFEKVSIEQGSFALHKFYDEGAYATIACLWIDENNHKYYWLTYGDSVVFKYNSHTKDLFYSINNLSEFNNPPFLVNCIHSTKEEGFCMGQGFYDKNEIFFIASDALSHYILTMYLISKNKSDDQILAALNQHSKNAMVLKNALLLRNVNFEARLTKLIRSSKNRFNFMRHLYSLYNKKYLTSDDYSFVCVQNL